MATPNDLFNTIRPFLNRQYSGSQWNAWYNSQTGERYASDAYFCASGLSWAYAQIGMGPAVGGAWIWTVGWYRWCQANLTQVSVRDAQPGDIGFSKFGAAGDRGTAPVNHVWAVLANPANGYALNIRGFNEGNGGTGGWVADRYYTNIVAIFRPNWGSATPNEEDELNAEEKQQLSRINARVKDVKDLLTAGGGQKLVQTTNTRVRDVKDILTGGTGRNLLEELLAGQSRIEKRLSDLEARK